MDEVDRIELEERFAIVVGLNKEEWQAVQDLESIAYLVYCRTENPIVFAAERSVSTTPLMAAWQHTQIRHVPR